MNSRPGSTEVGSRNPGEQRPRYGVNYIARRMPAETRPPPGILSVLALQDNYSERILQRFQGLTCVELRQGEFANEPVAASSTTTSAPLIQSFAYFLEASLSLPPCRMFHDDFWTPSVRLTVRRRSAIGSRRSEWPVVQ